MTPLAGPEDRERKCFAILWSTSTSLTPPSCVLPYISEIIEHHQALRQKRVRALNITITSQRPPMWLHYNHHQQQQQHQHRHHHHHHHQQKTMTARVMTAEIGTFNRYNHNKENGHDDDNRITGEEEETKGVIAFCVLCSNFCFLCSFHFFHFSPGASKGSAKERSLQNEDNLPKIRVLLKACELALDKVMGGRVYARNRYNVANWHSRRKPRIFCGHFRRVGTSKERLVGGVDANCAFPVSTCLDASNGFPLEFTAYTKVPAGHG